LNTASVHQKQPPPKTKVCVVFMTCLYREAIQCIINNQSVINMPPTTALSPTATPRRSRRKDARPGELLAAALSLFVEKGFAATTVEAVAARAGVSKGTLFLYFPSKVELFQAVVRENIVGRLSEWAQTIERHEGPQAPLLRELMHQWWQRIGMTEASGITKLVLSEAGQFPDIARFYQTEVIEPGQALMRQILRRGVATGEFRALNLEHTIHGLFAPMLFLVMWKHSLGLCVPAQTQLDPEAFIDSQLQLLLHGLLPPTPHTP
jgi:AcrR family transcriptional regulator